MPQELTGGMSRRWIMGLLLFALVLSACSGSTDSTTTEPGETPATTAPTEGTSLPDDGATDSTVAPGGPTSGGTLRFALDQESRCFDPHQETSIAAVSSIGHVVETLIVLDPESGEVLPSLASTWEVNDDATSFTFSLREGVTFSDGSDLTADDVVASLQEVVNLGAAAPRGASAVAGLASIDAVDDYTVMVTFSEPAAPFLQAASSPSLGIISEESFETAPEARCTGEWVGSGPFVVEEVVNDQHIYLNRRDDYVSGSPLVTTDGPAYLDRIEYQVVLESGVRTGLLDSGQAEAIMSVFPEDEEGFATDDYWLVARAAPGFTNSLIVNTQRPLLQEAAVRQALQLAIDRQALIDFALSPRSEAPTGLLSSATPFHSDFSDLFPTDAAQAAQILDDAGWEVGDDGIRTRDGERLSLTVVFFLTQTPLMEVLQQQFAQVGVELVLEGFSPDDRFDIEEAGDFDFIQRNLTQADPDVLRNQLHIDFSNYLYRDARGELDDLLDAQAAAGDTQARQDLVDEVQDMMLAEWYVLPLSHQTRVFAGTASLMDMYLDAESLPIFVNAWLDS